MKPARDKHVLLYDGHCAFCRACRDILKGLDHADQLEPLSFQDPGVLEQFPTIGYERAMASMHLVMIDGRIFGEEAMLRELFRLTPWYLRWMGVLFVVPGVSGLARRMYRWVARNRYRLSGAPPCEDACEVHLSDTRSTRSSAGRSTETEPAEVR